MIEYKPGGRNEKNFNNFGFMFFCFGCGRDEKNITINIYDNKDSIDQNKEAVQSEEDVGRYTYNESTNTFNSVYDNTEDNKKENESQNQISNDTINDKVVSSVSDAKNWYNSNKDELKDISNEILQDDINNINNLIDSTKDWYNENKDDLVATANEIYYNDKETISDLFDKIKN